MDARYLIIIFSALLLFFKSHAQTLYRGADLSYVNEMQDCGVVYYDNGQARDPYELFAEKGCNLVRLRLWHTPAWYDTLNTGNRYSDLADVRRSIARAHAAGMEVLLDFHLSDTWADPSRQIAPQAWWSVLDDTPTLSDSVYQYVYGVLAGLAEDDLWPALIQLGNETNRGILLSPEQNASGWVMDWSRNATLFNRGLAAIRDAATTFNKSVKTGIHLAGPANVEWFVEQFTDWGVTDFDFFGISYYWAWHQPTTIEETGGVIERLRAQYPAKEVIILETGYIWTNDWNDAAANIITDVHPLYTPASPQAQYNWLVDLTEHATSKGASGVIYWEPAWVSSPCFTPWGQGSHQEHATFFDFNNNVLQEGGMEWFDADLTVSVTSPGNVAPLDATNFRVLYSGSGDTATLLFETPLSPGQWELTLLHLDGKHLQQWNHLTTGMQETTLQLSALSTGIYFLSLQRDGVLVGKQPLVVASR
ncbi:MAG: glycosyl hydrolase 53 family protein [Saprospiraceae bacterium]